MKRMAVLILLAVVILFTLSNCKPDTDDAVPDETPVTVTPVETPEISTPPSPVVTPPAPVESEEVYSGPYSPLSGLPTAEENENVRPYAIMINNIKNAQPLLGVTAADIIYEVPVEGGITRIMAIYHDVSEVGTIGSIRSARPAFIEIAQGHDAVYIHAGGSTEAYNLLYGRKITALDGVNGSRQDIFYRDSARRSSLGYEHSLVSSGGRISEYVPEYGFRQEHDIGYEVSMSFSDDASLPGGSPAENVTIPVTPSKKTSFAYNDEDGQYQVSQFGKDIVDGETEEELKVANIIVIKTSISVVDSEGRLNVKLVGSGSGYLFTGGEYVEIGWSKASSSTQFEFTYADGSEVELATGRSYICVTYNSTEPSVS